MDYAKEGGMLSLPKQEEGEQKYREDQLEINSKRCSNSPINLAPCVSSQTDGIASC